LIIPSGGLVSLLSVSAIVISIVIVTLQYGWRAGAVYFTVAVFVAPFIVAGLIRWLPSSPLGEMIMNLPHQALDEEQVERMDEREQQRREMVGKIGRARTKMLPGGVIELAGRRYDAVSRGPAIDPGQLVEVVEVDGFRILVQPARPDAQLTVAPAAAHQNSTVQEPASTSLDAIVPDPFDDTLA
jgi:membrane-bound serine protease (ClpP class)